MGTTNSSVAHAFGNVTADSDGALYAGGVALAAFNVLAGGSGSVFLPQMYNAQAGLTNGVNDDTNYVKAAIDAAVAAGDGVVDLGSGTYRCTAPIGTLITKPIKIVGRGAWLLVDPALSGDLLSFSNAWYGSDATTLTGGGAGVGTSLTAAKWPSRASRKNGVLLSGFKVVGDRDTVATQNGIVFYDRNDNAIIRDVEIHFIKGYGLVLSGIPSNKVSNAASVMRESHIENVHVRWCGDSSTARPAVVFNSTDRGSGSSDDACNYVEIINMKVIFSDGLGFQSNCHNLNSNQFSNNNVQLIADSPINLSTASSAGSQASITNGVLTIGGAGTITGTFAVGQFLDNANVPIGTYISSILTGTGGAGTYQLANKFHDISALTVASGGNMSTLRCNIPFVQIHGGHVGDRWDIVINGSNTAGTGAPGISFNHNTLHASTAKTAACELDLFVGGIDLGIIFTVVNSLTGRWRVRNSVTSITALNITQSVVIDSELIGGSSDLAIGGTVTNLHVRPGGQDVVTALPNAIKYPNCVLWVKSGTTWTRNASDGSAWYTT